MSGQRGYVGETEFSCIEVEINDDDPDEWPWVEITVTELAMPEGNERSLTLSMDEARCLIAGLAWIIR